MVETCAGRARARPPATAAGLTGGEGVLESDFAGYEPVSGEQPTRRRTTPNPLNLDEYVLHIARRV